MKEKTTNLYFAKCRKCIMDIVMNYYDNEKEITPRPDYIEYYTILLKKDENQFVDLFDRSKKMMLINSVSNTIETYDFDLIMEYEPLSNYLEIEKANKKEAEITLSVICKTKSLNLNYGYKDRK